MTTLTIHLAGIMYFNGCDARERSVFVPDGTKGMGRIPPHYASIWVEPAQLASDDWFAGEKHSHQVNIPTDDGHVVVTVFEYRIPYTTTLMFPDGNGGPATFVNVQDALKKLEDLAPGFVVDRGAPDTIVKFPVRAGKLEAFEFKNVAVVKWTIADPSSLTITATAGRETKSITLKEPSEDAGVEVVFGNTSDLLTEEEAVVAGPAPAPAPAPAPEGCNPFSRFFAEPSLDMQALDREDHQHFKLFAKLRVGRKHDDIAWVAKKRKLEQLVFDHDYLSGLRSGSQIPDPGCEGTCC